MLYSFYFRSSNMYSDSFFSLFIRQKYPSKLGNLCYTNKQFTHCGSTLLCSNSSNLFIVRWILLFWSTEQFQAKIHSYFSISYHHYLRSFNNKSFERKKFGINIDSLFRCHSRLTQFDDRAIPCFSLLENEAWRLALSECLDAWKIPL